MKKAMLIIGLIFSVVLMGEVLMLFTGLALIANWGSIIIPSFLAGIFAGLLLHDKADKWFSEVLAGCVVAIKLVLFFIQVDNPSSLAVLGIIIFYFIVSYISVFGGKKLIRRAHKRHHIPPKALCAAVI